MKSVKWFKAAAVATLALATICMAGCGGGGDKKAAAPAAGKKVEYKLAYALPANHPLAKGVESFIAKVKDKTKGEVVITSFPAGQLYNDKTMNDAIMTGGVDMGLNTVGRWATIIPAMEVFDVPFVFPGYEKVDTAIDGGMGKILEEELAKKHVKVVYWADYGFVQYANNKGTIDGQSSGTSAMRDRKMYEVTKYLTITNHASPEFIVAMNDKSFAKMSEPQQKAFMEAAREVRDTLRKNAKAEDLKGLEDLKAKGMEVYVVPESEIKNWQAATKPVWDIFTKHAGEQGKKILDLCTK